MIKRRIFTVDNSKLVENETAKIGVAKQAAPQICTMKSPCSSDVIGLISGEEFLYFTDQAGRSCVQFHNGKCFENVSIDSQAFKMFVNYYVYEVFDRPVKEVAIKEAFIVLSGRAQYSGHNYPLEVRVARNDGDIWLDCGNRMRNAIRVSADGWELCDSEDVPIIFKRQAHMLEIPSPEYGGSIDDLQRFIHTKDENTWILLKVWIVTAFIPDIARPCLVFHGLQGAGKSLAGKLLKMLVDPSRLDLLPTPSNHNEFIQQINNNYLIVLDNLDCLKPWMSDDLCRAITGGAFSKRKLYSDSEDIIFEFKRLFIINGINNPAAAADLLDRSILIELDRIGPEERRSETEIFAEFDSLAPGILGNILDILSKALATVDTFNLPVLPRMADWAKIGYAAAEIMGIGGDRFLRAYQQNIQLQHAEISDNDLVASTVSRLIDEELQAIGTPTQIFEMCKALLPEEVQKSRNWPKTTALFSKRLKLVSNNLRELGIIIDFGKGKERIISITKR